MGTRSIIGVMHGENCKFVYCHWDGYLAHNGVILQEHYDSAKANHLVAMGDISSLGRVIGEQHPFSPHESADAKAAFEAAEKAGYTTFYGRDRGEKGVDFRSVSSFDAFLESVSGSCAEYYYIMKDGVWYCGAVYGPLKYKLVPLSEAILAEAQEAA